MTATTLDLSAIRTDATSYAASFRTLIGVSTLDAAAINAALGYTAANDASVVKLTGSQTIAGAKTFSNNAVFSGSITANGTFRSGTMSDGFRTEENSGHIGAILSNSTYGRSVEIGFVDALYGNSWRIGRTTLNDTNFYIQPGYAANGNISGTNGVTISNTGAITVSGSVTVGVYTYATVPSASASTGGTIRISDRSQRLATSDGTNWNWAGTTTAIS